MRIAKGGWSHIFFCLAIALLGVVVGQRGCIWVGGGILALGIILVAFMVYFFRDPERLYAGEQGVVLSGADGWVRKVEEVQEGTFLKMRTVRISTFLTPFDVHVNRSPVAGNVTKLAYTPGKHILTIQQAASEYNEHSSILIEGGPVRCLVCQIVGPIVRRVVYWLREGQTLDQGDRIGIMKFGSRLDVYLPADEVEVVVQRGDRVFAGRSVLARLKKRGSA